MPTALENAKAAEARRLARAGLGPDGKPLNQQPARGVASGGVDDDDDEDDDHTGETDEEREEREEREREEEEQRAGGGGGDDLAEEVRQLRQQLAALQGRVAPAQRDNEDFRQLLSTQRQQHEARERELQEQLDALQAKIDEQQNNVSLDSLLTDDEKKDIDPIVLAAMTKIATAAAKRAAPAPVDVRATTLTVLNEREQRRVTDYRTAVMSDPTKGLHKLAQLAYDPAFIAWSRKDDNDVDSVVTSLLNAKSTEEVDRYAKLVARRITAFNERDNRRQSADARGSLGGHMRREARPRRTPEQEQELLNKAKNLARSSSPKDRAEAQRILNELK